MRLQGDCHMLVVAGTHTDLYPPFPIHVDVDGSYRYNIKVGRSAIVGECLVVVPMSP